MSDIYLSLTESPSVVTLSQPVVSGVLSSNVTVANVVSVNVVTMPAITVQAAAPAVTTVAGTVTIGNFPSTQTIAGTVTANNPSLIARSGGAISDSVQNIQVVGGRTAGGGGSSSYAPIYVDTDGSVIMRQRWTNAANTANAPINENTPLPVQLYTGLVPSSVTIGATIANSVTIGSLPAISGTVTANLNNDNFSGALTNYVEAVSSHNAFPVEISYQPSVTIGSLPNGALTTRFGSVATANLAFITSAVTNTSRKYLLAQNISAGTVTIGIGFSPTTTQGIQLTAGAGLTFDAFCPTGAIYWLGAVTGAPFTILEG